MDQGDLGKKGLREFSYELATVAERNLSKVAMFSAPGPIYFDPAALNVLHKWLITNYTVPPLEGARGGDGSYGGSGGGRVVHTTDGMDGCGGRNSKHTQSTGTAVLL